MQQPAALISQHVPRHMDISAIIMQWQQQQQQQSAASLPTAFIATGVLLLLVPKLRHFVFNALETVIATFLLLVLIGAVLGLPFGKHLGPTLVAAVSIPSHGSAVTCNYCVGSMFIQVTSKMHIHT